MNALMNKQEIRRAVLIDVAKFAQTHLITILPPQKVRVKAPCHAKEKQIFKGRAPVNRPAMNFDLMPNH